MLQNPLLVAVSIVTITFAKPVRITARHHPLIIGDDPAGSILQLNSNLRGQQRRGGAFSGGPPPFPFEAASGDPPLFPFGKASGGPPPFPFGGAMNQMMGGMGGMGGMFKRDEREMQQGGQVQA